MTVSFKLNIKFTANSFRRITKTGKGTNEWITLDSEVIHYLMKIHGFSGIIMRTDFDAIYG